MADSFDIICQRWILKNYLLCQPVTNLSNTLFQFCRDFVHLGCSGKINYDEISVENLKTSKHVIKMEYSNTVTNMWNLTGDDIFQTLSNALHCTLPPCLSVSVTNVNRSLVPKICEDSQVMTFSRPCTVVSLPFTQLHKYPCSTSQNPTYFATCKTMSTVTFPIASD